MKAKNIINKVERRITITKERYDNAVLYTAASMHLHYLVAVEPDMIDYILSATRLAYSSLRLKIGMENFSCTVKECKDTIGLAVQGLLDKGDKTTAQVMASLAFGVMDYLLEQSDIVDTSETKMRITVSRTEYNDAIFCIGKRMNISEMIKKSSETVDKLVSYVLMVFVSMCQKTGDKVISFTEEDFKCAVENISHIASTSDGEKMAALMTSFALSVMYYLFAVAKFKRVVCNVETKSTHAQMID